MLPGEKEDEQIVAEIMRRRFFPTVITHKAWEGFYFAGHEIRITEATDCYGAVVWPSVQNLHCIVIFQFWSILVLFIYLFIFHDKCFVACRETKEKILSFLCLHSATPKPEFSLVSHVFLVSCVFLVLKA